MNNSNFRFDQDPFGVYQFDNPIGGNLKGAGSSFLSILGIIIAILGIVVILTLRKTIWRLITNTELLYLKNVSEDETATD